MEFSLFMNYSKSATVCTGLSKFEKHLLPFSIAQSLPQLELLDIDTCAMDEIIAGGKYRRNSYFAYPKLKSLILSGLLGLTMLLFRAGGFTNNACEEVGESGEDSNSTAAFFIWKGCSQLEAIIYRQHGRDNDSAKPIFIRKAGRLSCKILFWQVNQMSFLEGAIHRELPSPSIYL